MKFTVKFLLYFTCFVHYSFGLNGQTDKLKGYVINNQQDTLYGYLDYKKGKKNENSVRFQRLLIGESRTFYPSDIIAFHFSGARHYETHEIDGKLIFLEKLVAGKTNLYYSGKKGAFYISSNEMPVIELSENSLIMKMGDKEMSFKDYKALLAELFSDKPTTVNKIDTVKLNYTSLSNLFQHYNNQHEVPMLVYARPKAGAGIFKSSVTHPYSRVKIGITGGVYFNSIDFVSKKYFDSYSYITSRDPVSFVSPTLGAFVEYTINKRFVDYVLSAELLFNRFSHGFAWENKRYSFDTYEYNSQINSTYLRVPLMIELEIGNKRVKPVIGIGIFRALSIGGEAVLDIYNVNKYTGESHDREVLFNSLNQRGTIIGLGINYDINSYKTLHFSIRHEKGRVENQDLLMENKGTYIKFAINL
jgi:hypothetical protein